MQYFENLEMVILKTDEQILAECIAIDKANKAAAEKAARDDFNKKVKKIQKIRDLMIKSLQIKTPTDFTVFYEDWTENKETVGFNIFTYSCGIGEERYYLLLDGRIMVIDTQPKGINFLDTNLIPENKVPGSLIESYTNSLFENIERNAIEKFGVNKKEIKKILR